MVYNNELSPFKGIYEELSKEKAVMYLERIGIKGDVSISMRCFS